MPRVGAFSMLVLLLFAIPAQADEIEPEPEPAPIERAEPAPEPEPEPDPEPEPAMVSEDEDEEDDDEGYARSGFYLGASMTGAWYSEIKDEVRDGLNAITPPNQQVPRVHMEQPFGIRLRTGYRFLPRLAAEVQFTWYSNAIIELDDGQQNTLDAVKVETLALSGNLKGYLLTGRVQPFVSAGGGLLHANTSDNKLNLGVKNDGDAFAGRFGGGVDLYINPNFVAVVEGGYVLPTGKLDKLDHVTWAVGLVYRF